ncbi:alpha-ketoglutarate-dependent dioxygenase AlkB [Ponticaulis profundi]|uniref:Alpha-ketoglutarate-dependent dioxygenase AlkB n=1 Tax=Ponticaulis profundi TaxID=2665222 RepID=A0ABW1S9V4_9PROT
MEIRPNGAQLFSGYLNRAAQESLRDDIRDLVALAPLYRPTMPGSGKPLSVRMSNAGEVGWVSDQTGYRYQPRHPVTGTPWPDIPDSLLTIWTELVAQPHARPDACLINFYDPSARMGLHQDRDEQDFSCPVLSISLGDDALFRLGGTTRRGKTQSFRLRSGDIMLLAGEDRLAYHGIDRIYPATSSLLKQGGRINITMRKAL